MNFVGLGELLFDRLLGRQYAESQLWYARQRDAKISAVGYQATGEGEVSDGVQ